MLRHREIHTQRDKRGDQGNSRPSRKQPQCVLFCSLQYAKGSAKQRVGAGTHPRSKIQALPAFHSSQAIEAWPQVACFQRLPSSPPYPSFRIILSVYLDHARVTCPWSGDAGFHSQAQLSTLSLSLTLTRINLLLSSLPLPGCLCSVSEEIKKCIPRQPGARASHKMHPCVY